MKIDTLNIILASASPRRAELLKKITTDFKIIPAEIEEIINPNISAKANAENLALQKARAVETHCNASLIIACDTLGELDEWIFGKPKNKTEAKEFLKRLSGETHTVISGFCLKTDDQEFIDSEITYVTFKDLTDSEIEKYIAKNSVESYAGAYAIQGEAKEFVENVEGEIENVIGFPLVKIKNVLENLKQSHL